LGIDDEAVEEVAKKLKEQKGRVGGGGAVFLCVPKWGFSFGRLVERVDRVEAVDFLLVS